MRHIALLIATLASCGTGALDPDSGSDPSGGGDNGTPLGAIHTYTTFIDSPIRVPAPGVLLNVPEATHAILNRSSRRGELVFEANGGFSFVPSAGYSGSDSFTFSPWTGDRKQAELTVTLDIRPSATLATLVILAAHRRSAIVQPSVEQVVAQMAVVDGYFREYSYNAMGLAGVVHPDQPADVVGWYRLQSDACFNRDEIFALAAADPSIDVDFRAYRQVVVIVAQGPSCSLSAQSTIGRRSFSSPDGQVSIGLSKMSVANADASTLTHEIGHALGPGNLHGVFLDCGTLSWAEEGCTSVIYGDPYDNMSRGIGHWAAGRKAFMGWFNPISNRIVDVTTSGIYRLAPFESNDGRIKALTFDRGPGLPLYIEYRQPLGSDLSFGADADVFNGVLIRTGSALVDTTPPAAPYGPRPPNDAQLTPALHPGSTWRDPLSGHRVEMISADADGAVVQVVLSR